MKKFIIILLLIFNINIISAQPPSPDNIPYCYDWEHHHHGPDNPGHHHHHGETPIGTATPLFLGLAIGFLVYKTIKIKKIKNE